MPQSSNRSIDLLANRFSIPDHVVRREFVTETVVLNLKTGQYHGLNRTAGRMLKEISEAGTIEAAADRLAGEYELSVEQIKDDLVELCRQMLSRELIELAEPVGG